MEQLGRVSALLASFSALPWLVLITDPQGTSAYLAYLAAPTLSLSPSHNTFVQGERVKLTCTVPKGRKAQSFFFKELEANELIPEQNESTLEIPITHLDSRKTFTCYYSRRSGVPRASYWSDSVTFSIIEPPPPPTLSLLSQTVVYLPGEKATLICAAPRGKTAVGYTFHQETGDQVFKALPREHYGRTFTVKENVTERYSCVYRTSVSRRNIQSPRSNSVLVVRTEHPRPPTLSLRPQHPVYIQGEDVTLNCSAPTALLMAEYSFYKEQEGRNFEVQPKGHRDTFVLDGNTAGRFNCLYQFKLSGRLFRSPRSISVFVARTDPLQPPELIVDPPSGAVNEGEPLLISCLTNRKNTEKRFHFYKDGVEMDSSNEGSQRSSSELGDPSPNATLWIPQANSSQSGEFACSFEENMSSRWIISPWSQKVNVTVQAQDSSAHALGYSCLTLLFTVMVSLTCYYLWRRKRASKVETQFPPQRNEEETDCLERLEPQPTQTEARLKRLESVEEEGVSYSEIQFCLNNLKSMEEDSALYSNLQFQPSHGLKPVEKDQVLYSAIQFKPTRGVAN